MVSQKLPRRKTGLTTRDLDGQLAIYEDGVNMVHLLNQTGALVWSLLDGEHSLDDLQSEIRKRFLVEDEGDISGDIERLIEELRQKGMLEEGT
jgi:hypothetical protein